MRTFSKSKLMALRQCPKRLWLEVHHPELREDSAATEASLQVGYQCGRSAEGTSPSMSVAHASMYPPHHAGVDLLRWIRAPLLSQGLDNKATGQMGRRADRHAICYSQKGR